MIETMHTNISVANVNKLVTHKMYKQPTNAKFYISLTVHLVTILC